MKRLTKSQYEAVSEAIRKAISVYEAYGIDTKTAKGVAHQIAFELTKHDNQFKHNEFIELCGITD